MQWDSLQRKSRCVPGRERRTCRTSEQQCSTLTGGGDRGLCRLDSSAGRGAEACCQLAPQGAKICGLICCVDQCDTKLGSLLDYRGCKLLILWTALARSKTCSKHIVVVLA